MSTLKISNDFVKNITNDMIGRKKLLFEHTQYFDIKLLLKLLDVLQIIETILLNIYILSC